MLLFLEAKIKNYLENDRTVDKVMWMSLVGVIQPNFLLKAVSARAVLQRLINSNFKYLEGKILQPL